MKKVMAILAASAIVAMAGSAMAATGSLNVSANITAACSVTGGNLDFGTLVVGSPASATSTGVSITCTKNDPYAVSLDNGKHAVGTQNYLLNTTNTDTIAYALTLPAGPYSGTGAAQSFTISGNIAAAAFATASAGTYQDTVAITVTP